MLERVCCSDRKAECWSCDGSDYGAGKEESVQLSASNFKPQVYRGIFVSEVAGNF